MVWAKLDDEILDNPKIAEVGVYGFAMHVAAITWCCRNLTDGHVPRGRVRCLIDFDGLADELEIAKRLVDAGLWDEADAGYAVHDFLVYNPSREKVLAERQRAKDNREKPSAKRRPRVRVRSPDVPATVAVCSDGPDPDPVPDPTLPAGESLARAHEDAPLGEPEPEPTLDGPMPAWATARLEAIAMASGVTFDGPLVWLRYISNRLDPTNPKPVNAFDFNGWLCNQVRIERRDRERERDVAQERANRPPSSGYLPRGDLLPTKPAPYHGVNRKQDAERDAWEREAGTPEERAAAAKRALAVFG